MYVKFLYWVAELCSGSLLWKYKVGDAAHALHAAWSRCREGVNMSHVFT